MRSGVMGVVDHVVSLMLMYFFVSVIPAILVLGVAGVILEDVLWVEGLLKVALFVLYVVAVFSYVSGGREYRRYVVASFVLVLVFHLRKLVSFTGSLILLVVNVALLVYVFRPRKVFSLESVLVFFLVMPVAFSIFSECVRCVSNSTGGLALGAVLVGLVVVFGLATSLLPALRSLRRELGWVEEFFKRVLKANTPLEEKLASRTEHLISRVLNQLTASEALTEKATKHLLYFFKQLVYRARTAEEHAPHNITRLAELTVAYASQTEKKLEELLRRNILRVKLIEDLIEYSFAAAIALASILLLTALLFLALTTLS